MQISREQAIEKFGVSYGLEAVGFPQAKTQTGSRIYDGVHNLRVVEYLGDTAPYKTPEDAAKAGREKVAKNIGERLKEIGEWENSAKTKFKIAAASIGLKSDAEEYLTRVDLIRQAATVMRGLQETGITVEHKKLPGKINIPVILDVGQKIYRVEAYYLERAMDVAKTPVTEHTITEISLRESWWGKAHGEYDYLVDYRLDNGESFNLAKDTTDNAPISNNVVNYNYFTSLEAAQDHLRGIAQRITNAMKPYL